MRIVFAGTPEFAASALAALLTRHQIVAVLTQPDRPAGRGMQLLASPVKQLAQQHGIPVLQPNTLKTEPAQREIAALDADVMVVAAYGLILPKAVLQMPRNGCLNIHASLLPRWRGAAPIQRAIQSGDAETGITIMQMDEGLDTGDMLLRHVCPIVANETAQTLHDKLADIGATAIVDALELLGRGELVAKKQDNSLATYAAKLLKTEAQLDWTQNAQQLQRTIRAFNPFPVCHIRFGELTIKLWQADLACGSGESGTVLAIDKSGITVACGQGALLLTVLQRPGGKAQPAFQFLQAVPIKVGDRFC
jgi:methionyl-tRNA formyltransferase